MSGADPDTAEARRWRYQSLLRTLAYQTGDPQPATVARCSRRSSPTDR